MNLQSPPETTDTPEAQQPMSPLSPISPTLGGEFLSTIKHVGLPLFVWMAAGGALDQWLTQKMQNLITDPAGLSNWIWFYGLVSALTSLVFPMTGLIWVIKKRVTLVGLSQLMIETLRAWGQALSWSFLLIVPGLVRWLRLSFVPYITLESQSYASGEIDALKTSRELSRGTMGAISGLLFVFTLLIPVIVTSVDDQRIVWQTPVASLSITLFETLCTILFFLLLRRLYYSAAKKISLK